MGFVRGISSHRPRTTPHIKHGPGKGQRAPADAARIAEQRVAKERADDGREERHAVGEIGGAADAAGGDGNGDALADRRAKRIIDAKRARPASEHPAQILAAAPPRFMAAAATARIHHHLGLISVQRADHAAHRAAPLFHAHQRRSGAVSSRGRRRKARVSRARKIRERTVPIGQSMMPAISS